MKGPNPSQVAWLLAWARCYARSGLPPTTLEWAHEKGRAVLGADVLARMARDGLVVPCATRSRACVLTERGWDIVRMHLPCPHCEGSGAMVVQGRTRDGGEVIAALMCPCPRGTTRQLLVALEVMRDALA